MGVTNFLSERDERTYGARDGPSAFMVGMLTQTSTQYGTLRKLVFVAVCVEDGP